MTQNNLIKTPGIKVIWDQATIYLKISTFYMDLEWGEVQRRCSILKCCHGDPHPIRGSGQLGTKKKEQTENLSL